MSKQTGNHYEQKPRRTAGAKRSDPPRRKEPLLMTGQEARGDLAYIGRCLPPPAMVLLLRKGNAQVVVPTLEYGRMVQHFPVSQVWTPSLLGLSARDGRRQSRWILALLRKNRLRQVTVGRAFPLALARELEQAGIRLKMAAGSLMPERACKSPEELRNIRKAQQAAVIAMRAACTTIAQAEIGPAGELSGKNGVLTSEYVRGAMNRTLLEHGCFCEEIIVAGGGQGANPHERGSGPLKAGRPIVIDVFPKHLESGYWGDLTRTVIRGPVAPVLRHMYNSVKMSYHKALTLVRPGMACCEIHRAAAHVLAARGYKTELRDGLPAGFIHGTGHGVGLEVHEEPSVGANSQRLRRGHVITIEPGLYYAEWGGIRIEDTVMVTERGWRYFAPCERKFELGPQ